MPDGLKSVLDDAVKIINFIKARPSNSAYLLCFVRKWEAFISVYCLTLKLGGYLEVEVFPDCLSLKTKFTFFSLAMLFTKQSAWKMIS